VEKESENQLMQRWMLHYQHDMTFQSFKGKLRENQKEIERKEVNSKLTEEDILNDVEDILNSYRGGGEYRNI